MPEVIARSLGCLVGMISIYRDRDERVVKTDYELSNAEPETPLETFCRVAKAEHRIEECRQRATSEAALSDYEVRNGIGWHHHQTLSLIATRFLTVETRRVEKKAPAITLPQLRRGVALVLRAQLECDSPPTVAARIQQRLRRNQQARDYHWIRPNIRPPTNVDRRRF